MQTLCLIIPCYNEAERLPVHIIRQFITTHPYTTLCLVNDGSQDDTLAKITMLSQESPDQIWAYNLPYNQGKAEAVRQGMLHVHSQKHFNYVGFFDADMATPLQQIDYFRHFCEGTFTHSLIIGSRIKRLGAKIERSALRHYLGRIFSTVASIILQLPVYDTQCGAKLVKAELVPALFGEPFLSKWLFDIELFARLSGHVGRQKVLTEVMEIPLQIWLEKGDSRLKTRDLIRVFPELYKIHRKYKADRKKAARKAEAVPSQDTGSA
ncbi:MAG: glycosyltransferase [Bacteroidota bacterium]